jgi:hypothetical protein
VNTAMNRPVAEIADLQLASHEGLCSVGLFRQSLHISVRLALLLYYIILCILFVSQRNANNGRRAAENVFANAGPFLRSFRHLNRDEFVGV